MIQAFINGILNLFFFLLGKIGDIMLAPIILLLNGLIPDFSEYNEAFIDLLNTKVWPFLCWIKLSFLNITCYSPTLWSILVYEITMIITASVGFRVYRFIYQMLKVYRGTAK